MDAFNEALARASRGLDWSYPCLLWLADYLLAATGIDHAQQWRGTAWTEATARSQLARLAAGGDGDTAVERALDAVAEASLWVERDGPRQGAVMVGVFQDPDGVGFPAIFDGRRGWLVAMFGNATVVQTHPQRMWEVA